MMSDVFYNIPNEQYHHGEGFEEYLSSTQLKGYAVSPKFARFMLDNPQVQTAAMHFGSLFHDCMSAIAIGKTPEEALDTIVTFEPPVNEKTGQPYGATTKAYKEAYEAFCATRPEVKPTTKEEKETVAKMLHSLLNDCGATSEQVRKLLKWGDPEVSILYETEDGIKVKARPDLLTRGKIIDWKTTTLDDLTEESINRTILRYGYHISAAMYQWVAKQVLGEWKDFYLVFVQKQEPYDCIMVNMVNYGYRYMPDIDMVIPGPGAMEFKRLLDLHTKCVNANEWPGAETFIPGDKYRIMEIMPPRYITNKYLDE